MAASADIKDTGHIAGAPYGPNEAHWKGPDQVVPRIGYGGTPVISIARMLQHEFQDEFDIVVPEVEETTSTNPGSLGLRNVTAEEIFAAMNQLFNAQGLPLRWILVNNGNRPTAVLRQVESPAGVRPAEKKAEPKQQVVYVGNFVSSKWPIGRIAETLSEIVTADGPNEGSGRFVVKLHQPTDILVLSGTAAQLEFAGQTLKALLQQAAQDARAAKGPEDEIPSVRVTGAVENPGDFVLQGVGKMTLVEAINKAGGFTKFANQDVIQLTRGGQKRTFKWQDLVATKDPAKMIWLQPGDVVTVLEAPVMF
ncbi:MAG: SLBB domain-containing protein [Verrucomicrobia bacterium]|nr:SLBB domain-containing protein [Verrucomicrobiota bacterium]